MFQPTVVRLDSIDSTNLEAMRQARAGAPEGLCVVAREQTRGRGRLDRSWHSPRDAGLYLSIVLRPEFEMSRWPLISLAAALAVAEALERVCGLQVDIKWPNDVCASGKKLSGILAETLDHESGLAAIVGIGINLKDASVPADLRAQATSIETLGVKPDCELLLKELLEAFAQRYSVLSDNDGAQATIRNWCARSSYAEGRRVRVSLTDESFEGNTRGLERDGALRVETDEGKIRIVRAGDVTALRRA